jgi:hypothetical protein
MQFSLWDPPAKYHVDSFFTTATKYVLFASTSLYWPLWGCIFKRVGFISSKEPGVGSWAYIPTCLPVALDEDGSSLQLCFMLCTHKVEDLCNWIYVVILILLQWLLYFVLWCYLLIQGMAQIHRSSTLIQRWGAAEWYQSIVLPIGSRP